jgi:8-oxo-dGTP pyrophosphatase MutT (NUDIX family)
MQPDITAGPLIQAGAVPFRTSAAGTEVLLITSRTSKSWIFPKGTIEAGQTASEAAVREAFEEAGIAGRLLAEPIGTYRYARLDIEYVVEMFAMEVTLEHADWPEKAERQRQWVPLDESQTLIGHAHLERVVLDFRRRFALRR